MKPFLNFLFRFLFPAAGCLILIASCGKGWDYSDRHIICGQWSLSLTSFEDASTNIDTISIKPDGTWELGKTINRYFLASEGGHGKWEIISQKGQFITEEKEHMTNRMFYHFYAEDRVLLQQVQYTNRLLFLYRRK